MGEQSVQVIINDATYAVSTGQPNAWSGAAVMYWGTAADCREGGLESTFKLDLVGTPFQVDQKPLNTYPGGMNIAGCCLCVCVWCVCVAALRVCVRTCKCSALTKQMAYAGFEPHGSASCTATACAGSIGGRCAFGGFIRDIIGPYDSWGAFFITLLVPNGISV